MLRSALLVAVVATTALAASAQAAPPQQLGQIAPPGLDGACGICSVLQFGDTGSQTYKAPTGGVLTKFNIFVGLEVEPTDKVQPRTFRTAGPPNATVISQGAQHALADMTAGASNIFFDRVPMAAGDVLGARFEVLNQLDATPMEFMTGSSADVAGVLYPPPDPGVGTSFTVTPATNYRLNLRATLESDDDADGYGDTSQDLCPGDGTKATVGCSGTLLGSALQGRHSFGGGGCSYACLRIQKTVGGASTAAPFDGVVVRWRVLGPSTGAYRLRVVSAGAGDSYTVLRSSAEQNVTTAPSAALEEIRTFPTRLAIPAGAYVGLVPPQFQPQHFKDGIPGSSFVQINDGPDGTVSTSGAAQTREAVYSADVEPDADRDAYGDITQDDCPTDATTQGTCPATPPAGGGTQTVPPPGPPLPTPPTPAATTPSITALSASRTRFRIARRGASTRIRLRLSERAGVRFTIHRRVACKPARRGCARFVTVHAFGRDLPAGASSLAYTGRYRRRGKTLRLKPGVHRLTAVARTATGRSSAPRRISLTVRRPR